jgi:hypothetical protein
MKKMLQFGRHFLRAKGRHGTHSPFVYAFVEQVLRSKEHFSIKNNTAAFSRKEIDLLARTIKYLKPSRIVVDAEIIGLLKEIISATKQAHITLAAVDATSTYQQVEGGNTLIICSNNKAGKEKLLSDIIQQHTIFALLLKPHANEEVEKKWYELCALPNVKMRLDLWHFGLLVNDPSFKGSQYFRLR